ncbi:hypothetical protein BAU28_14865 [Bacillus paramycoides]|uniref:Uncharacterized protein n=1 Tax=Bacillus paramycoides TaxID=2026194 RepID=A0A1J9UIY7_9BACI|nr:hypothetical protein BAU28_14865 [Bacillus paramycoides]
MFAFFAVLQWPCEKILYFTHMNTEKATLCERWLFVANREKMELFKTKELILSQLKIPKEIIFIIIFKLLH